jgi:hypothetical protein
MRCGPPPFRVAHGVVRNAGEGADFAHIPRLPMSTGAFGARVGWLRPRSTLGHQQRYRVRRASGFPSIADILLHGRELPQWADIVAKVIEERL